MTLTEKLLGYLNRVFDKGPDSVLALRLNYDGVMTWRVSAGVLTTTVTGGSGGPLTVALSGFSMSGLAAYLAAQPGYSVPFVVTGDMASRSALALIETSGNQAQSNGDHLLAFQSVLWAYMNAQSGELSTAQIAISEALLQIAAITASDTWVDEHGSYYGVARTNGEADVSYVARIVSEITRARGNGVAIAEAVKLGATASYVTITDVPTVTVSGGGVGSYGLFDVDVEIPVESVLTQPQIEANTLAVLNAMRDAGTHVRKLRYIRTAKMMLWAGAYTRAGHYLTLGFDRYPFLFDGTYSYDGSYMFDGIGSAPAVYTNPSFGNVKLLMHAEGSIGSQTYTDSSSYSRAPVGNSNALVSSAVAYRGTSSINFTGGVNLQVPVGPAGINEWERMGTDAHPMTMECAFYLATGAPGGTIIGAPMLTGGAFGWLSLLLFNMHQLDASLHVLYNGVTTAVNFLTKPSQDAIHMLAVEVTGSTSHRIRMWLDGVWQGEVIAADTITSHSFSFGELVNNDHHLNISRRQGGDQFIGFIDELRISEESFLPAGSNYTVNPGQFPNL